MYKTALAVLGIGIVFALTGMQHLAILTACLLIGIGIVSLGYED